MQAIIRFRNRQVFTQSASGSWSFTEGGKKETHNINDLLKKGQTISFVGTLQSVQLEAVNAPGLIVRSVYLPTMGVVLHEGEQEVNELMERLIQANYKAVVNG